MRTNLVLLALATAAALLTGCSGSGVECNTNPCLNDKSLGYQICESTDTSTSNDDSFAVTYKFGGKTCGCSGYYTGGCTTCQQQVTAYCGVAPDLAVPQDLSLPNDDLALED
jgi:hypothetical protein